MRLISKPPGYYRDEHGREYYWDGQHRSYIPSNPYQDFRRDYRRFNEALPKFLLTFYGIFLGIPLALVVIVLLLYGVAKGLQSLTVNSGVAFTILLIALWLWIMYWIVFKSRPRSH